MGFKTRSRQIAEDGGERTCLDARKISYSAPNGTRQLAGVSEAKKADSLGEGGKTIRKVKQGQTSHLGVNPPFEEKIWACSNRIVRTGKGERRFAARDSDGENPKVVLRGEGPNPLLEQFLGGNRVGPPMA